MLSNMKYRKIAAFVFFLVMFSGTVSCGGFGSLEELDNDTPVKSTAAEEETAADNINESETGTSSLSGEATIQTCKKSLKNEEKPEVKTIKITAKCSGDLKVHALVTDVYGINVLHSDVVGLMSAPVELDFDEYVGERVVTFCYDVNELRGVPEKNLKVLYYDEAEGFYNEIPCRLDTEKCEIMINPEQNGAYMLVDAYKWYEAWGKDTSGYEYEIDILNYKTDWERQSVTGSICEIADKEWAVENAPEFNVSTPEQLAGAVWYINSFEDSAYSLINIENDIDLGGYEWRPIGWSESGGLAFSGAVLGNGHTISNMKISKGSSDTGFIGYGLGCIVDNIKFVNAEVSGTGCTGVVGGQIYMSDAWSNITVSNCKVFGSVSDYGAVIGREAGTAFKECHVENVIINDKPFEYCSYREMKVAETPVVETFHISMNDKFVVTRDEHDGFMNLGWVFERDGIQLLDRNAEGETEYDAAWLFSESGTYDVYMTAFIDGTYIRVSNLIKYTVD